MQTARCTALSVLLSSAILLLGAASVSAATLKLGHVSGSDPKDNWQAVSMKFAGVLSNFEPRMGLLEIPYIFRDPEHMRKVLNGPVGEELAASLLKSGIRVLGWWERGPRMLTANKPVKALADVKGMKIRVPEIPVSVESWRAFGANPTPMAFGEVYSGLQQKDTK